MQFDIFAILFATIRIQSAIARIKTFSEFLFSMFRLGSELVCSDHLSCHISLRLAYQAQAAWSSLKALFIWTQLPVDSYTEIRIDRQYTHILLAYYFGMRSPHKCAVLQILQVLFGSLKTKLSITGYRGKESFKTYVTDVILSLCNQPARYITTIPYESSSLQKIGITLMSYFSLDRKAGLHGSMASFILRSYYIGFFRPVELCSERSSNIVSRSSA